MEKILKLSRTLLLCALILCLLFTSEVGFAVNTPAKESAVIPHENVTQVKELIELREKNSSTYLMSDGTHQFVGYAEDVHYKDERGKLVKIDCAMTSKNIPEGYVLGNGANSWYAYFADNLAKENAVLLKDSGYSIAFGFPNANPDSKTKKTTEMKADKSQYKKNLAKDNRAVIYQDVFKGVDIAYTTQTNALKEDIILKNASATNTFDVKISTEGLWAKEQDDTVIFVNNDGKEIFRLAPLYMVDANEKYSENVEFTLKQADGHVILTIVADESFLTESDTKFPVVVDPTIVVTGATNTYDSYVSQQSPNSNYYTSQALCTGTNTVYDLRRSFIKFNLPAYISANQVTGASLNLKYSMSFMDNAPNVKVHPVQSGWSSSAVTWNNQPSYNSYQSSNTATNIGNNWYSMNVTTMVKNWLAGHTNNGFVLKATTEPTNYANYTNFYSSDAPSPNKPELIVNYTVYNVSMKVWVDKTYSDYYPNNWVTYASSIAQKAAYPFSETLNLNISRSSPSVMTTTKSECQNAPEACNFSSCGNNCNNHHTNASKMLEYVDTYGSSSYGLNTLFYYGSTSCYGDNHGGVGGLAYLNGQSSIIKCFADWDWLTIRRVQHEWSHNYGARHSGARHSGDSGTCTSPCINNGGWDTTNYSVSDVWCSRCKNLMIPNLGNY